jgi:hypothetical protein
MRFRPQTAADKIVESATGSNLNCQDVDSLRRRSKYAPSDGANEDVDVFEL